MSFATDGNTEDLGPGYRRRGPISVAQLLEREGFQPASRSRTTRRALTGVAAGAVLALGAVVGSLLLNHGTANTNGDTLASGSQAGGDIVLAQNGQSSSTATAPSSTAQSTTPADQAATANASNNTAQVVQNGSTGKITITSRTSTATTHKATTAPGTTSGGNASSGPATTAPAPSSTPTASSTPTPSPQSSAAPTSTNGNSGNGNTSGATSSTPTSANSSLLGTVSGTLTSVTDPLFSWFGSN